MMRSLVLVALAATAAHAERPADYAYGIPLEAGAPSAFLRVAVPAAVYEGVVHRDLSDLRVFNADGEVVPFAFVPRPAAPRERPPAVALPMFPLWVDRNRRDVEGLALNVVRNPSGTTISVSAADGAAVAGKVLGGYVLDASELSEPIAALDFALPETAGAATMRMRIDASDDLAGWRTVMPDATLVDLEVGGQRLTKSRVEIAPVKAKYLRLSWPPGRAAIDFRAVRGEYADRAVETPRQWRAATGAPVADREGEYAYDLGGALPSDRIAVDLAEPNSIVPASLSARSSSTEPWQPAGATVFYRLAQAGGDVTSAPFAVDPRPQRYWLLRVDPRAGAGATPPPLRAGWLPQEIVFAARGRGPFVLAFGSEAAKAGALPVTTLIPGYEVARELPANIVVARAGPRTELGGPERRQKPPDVKRWALWATLVLGALVLGGMAWRLSREMKSPGGVESTAAADPPTPQ